MQFLIYQDLILQLQELELDSLTPKVMSLKKLLDQKIVSENQQSLF